VKKNTLRFFVQVGNILVGMLSFLVALLAFASASSDAHQRGVDLYKKKEYAAAIEALSNSIKSESPQSPDFRESALLIGQSYFMLSKAPEAIPWLEKAPASNEASFMLGYAYFQAGQGEKSEAAFAQLFGVKPESAAAHLLAAQMLLKREYEDQALAEAKKAVALDPNIPEGHFILGELAVYRGSLDEGIAEILKEITVNPAFAMAWYRLGDAYTRKERWEEAIPNLERAVWLNPEFSGPYVLLGKCYFKQQNFSNAEGILRRALVIDPRNREAISLLGRTLSATGRADEAHTVLEKLNPPSK